MKRIFACENFSSPLPPPVKRNDGFAPFLTEIRYITSLYTNVPLPSGKIGKGDVCESPTIIVFPFPLNVGDSL